MKILNKAKTNKGSALLIAILMSTVVLAVGFGVYQRTYKGLLFSAMWRQTQIAFASADAGLECAIYLDLHGAGNCFGVAVPGFPVVSPGSFTTDLAVGSACVNIKITKSGAVPDVTIIDARGYNDACGSTNLRRVERGLRITY